MTGADITMLKIVDLHARVAGKLRSRGFARPARLRRRLRRDGKLQRVGAGGRHGTTIILGLKRP